jgi:hypothetical protein
MAAAAARQLRALALADSVQQHADWAATEPDFFTDAQAERDTAQTS